VDHRLYGAELPVHGWHHLDGQIHLLVTLPDGSRGYFPAEGTALWGTATGDLPSLVLTADAVRRLRLLIEASEGRRRGRRSNAQQSK